MRWLKDICRDVKGMKMVCRSMSNASTHQVESLSTVRLSKLMTQQGLCSRREADVYIADGAVKVNGVVIDQLGYRVSPDVQIELCHEAREHQRNKVSLILNKPLGWISCQPEQQRYSPAIQLLSFDNEWTEMNTPAMNKRRRRRCFAPRNLSKMAVCGRLDINSTGLLLFTQDGTLARKILDGETSQVEKEYLVRIKGQVNHSRAMDAVQTLQEGGMEMDGMALKKMDVDILNEDQLRIILTEGKHRQIRRMCEAVGLTVLALKRVRIGGIKLGALPSGQWRYLTEKDKI